MNDRSLPKSYYNPFSMLGAALAVVALTAILFLFFIETLSQRPSMYVGITAYIILPVFLVLGLAAIPAGAFIERRRRRKKGSELPSYPRIDLNDPKDRLAFMVFSVGTPILLLMTGIGTFRAYDYTNSPEFCGTLCHQVMEPQWVTYTESPHARVACVDCHVGPGADWFVRSKLDGAYQVYATMMDKYPRPIPNPISNLRPAQETCEQCHWPLHFYNDKKRDEVYFLGDEENTKWTISLLMRTGGGMSETGPAEGIHWHMNIANDVEYVHLDERREEIAWVRVTDRDGNTEEYFSTDHPITPEELANLEVRSMDCLDCHNRPTHVFHAPNRSLNEAMARGRIDPSLPSIRERATRLLTAEHETTESARAAIRDELLAYYRDNHSDVLQQRPEAVESAIAEVQRIYGRNFFPHMKADWRAYPNHLEHLNSPGCFRCHADNMVSTSGRTVNSDCNSCHIILAQGTAEESRTVSLEGLEFEHPVDIGDAWQFDACHVCHAP